MRFLILTENQYAMFKYTNFDKLFDDILRNGINNLDKYNISTYDLYVILKLNYSFSLNEDVFDMFINSNYKFKKEKMNFEYINSQVGIEYEHSNLKPMFYSMNNMLIVIPDYYILYKFLGNDPSWSDDIIDYIYNNYDEFTSINNIFVKNKLNLTY